MNIEDLKKMSVQDALQAAAKFTGVDASVLDGVWNAESARGTKMLSPAGARGHFGLMPKTQALFEKKLGVKANPDDFHESLFIAAHHLKEDLSREGGNVVSALRAYNNGPKWREQRDPSGENAAYASRVLKEAKFGDKVPTAAPVREPATGSTPMPDPLEAVLPENKFLPVAASAGFVAGLQVNPQTTDIGAATEKLASTDLKRQQEIDNLSFIGAAQAQFMHQGPIAAVLRSIAREKHEPVPGYAAPEDRLGGYDAEDQDYMRGAASPKEFGTFKWEVDTRIEDQRIANLKGGWYAMGASVLAGLPEGALSGIGIAKAMALGGLGSYAAVQAGNASRAVALTAVENIGGNLAMTALEDAIGGRMSVFDYAGSALIGGIVSLPQIPGLRKAAGQEAQARLAHRIMTEASDRQAQVAIQAGKNLGDGATTEQLRAEMDRLEVQEVQKTTNGSISADRKLLPDMERLEADEAELMGSAKSKPVEQTARYEREFDPTAVKDANGQPLVKQTLSAREVLAGIADRPGDSVVRLLAGRLMTAIGDADVPIHVVDAIDIPKLGRGVTRAHYDPLGHHIILETGQEVNPAHSWIVVHEVAHAATVYKLESAVHAPGSTIAKVANDITQLREQLKSAWSKNDKQDDLVDYYLKNDKEFVAGLYSGRSTFTDFLKATKVNEQASAWNAFVDILRRLLNIQDSEMDAFTKAMNLSEELISIPTKTNIFTKSGPGASVVQAPMDPIASKYGLDLMPMATAAQKAEHKALVELYRKAENPEAAWNNIDPKWVDTLTAKFPALGSTGLHMLRSQNPVVRMVASELLESTTGAGGRRTTASLSKYLAERKYMGNTINEFQAAYESWRNAKGSGVWGDYTSPAMHQEFNKAVAVEMEMRRQKRPSQSSPAVVKAADVLEASYERMRVDQVRKQTIGWGALPESSTGYMPHRLSSEKVRNMTLAEHNAFHSALVDQFIVIEGWDMSFSSNLAAKYIDRAKVRAMGGHEVPANVHHTGAGQVIEDALKAMGMSRPEIQAQLAKFSRGGAGHTKKRLNLDLLQTFNDNGREFTLMDLFDTDQLQLVRNQAGRVSGETALADFGIMGRPGMQLLRRAMSDFGTDAGKAQPVEIQAFDQVAAEFLHEPFGEHAGRWMDRAMLANSLARLGGMGFTQFAEYINLATHMGVTKAFSAITSLPRLRAEAAALSKGDKVDNPIIGSIEVYGGAEFGTDAYKFVFPFDNHGLNYQVNGHDTITLGDRLLRGGVHAQGILSGWRAIHSAQQRGVAEQIVHKALKYIRDGGNDKALTDMGIDEALMRSLKADLGNIATFDANGNLSRLDITKSGDQEAAFAFVQAVHRGTGQIIQGTFIGETGKWAHNGWLRLMSQFRTFSITSVEKQWARNRNNHGAAKGAMMLMGAMSMAAPIYIARQYANSIGRPDQEAWLDKQLTFEKIARATMNYTAASGLIPDFVDAFASVTGLVEMTGGRAGSTTEFVGSVVAPAAGLVDDLWRSVQNSQDGTNVHGVVKNLPFAKLPLLTQAINAMEE